MGEALWKLTLLWERSHGINGLTARNLLPCSSHETSHQLLWQPQSVPCRSKWDLNCIINIEGFWRDTSKFFKLEHAVYHYSTQCWLKLNETKQCFRLSFTILLLFFASSMPKALFYKCTVDISGFQKSWRYSISNWSNIFLPHINSQIWVSLTLIIIRLICCARFSLPKVDLLRTDNKPHFFISDIICAHLQEFAEFNAKLQYW